MRARFQTTTRAIIGTSPWNRNVKNSTRRARQVRLKTWGLQRTAKWNAQVETLTTEGKGNWYFENLEIKNGRSW